MKKLIPFLILLSIIQSCGKSKCDSFSRNPIHPLIDKYFFVYSEKGDSIVYSDGTNLDTLSIKSREITDTLPGYVTCEIFHGKTIIIRGKTFIDPSVLIESTGGNNAVCKDTIYKKFYFSIFVNESKNTFMTADSIPINLIDSMNVLGNTFYNVLRIEVITPQAIVYFAPNKGLIQWTMNGKNYKLKK